MNPFLKRYKLQVISIQESRKMVDTNNISDGIIMSFETVNRTYCAEKQSKVSVYDIPFIENVLFGELKSSGRDLLLYVIYNLEKDSDIINLKLETVCKKMQISRPTVIRAITQLEDIGIIQRKCQSEYWVNPFYIFNGNRIAFYNKTCPDCVEIVAKMTK